MDIVKAPKDYANELIFYGWTLEDILNPQASSKESIKELFNQFAMRNQDYKKEVILFMKRYDSSENYY